MSGRIRLRGLRKVIRVDYLRRCHIVGFIAVRLNYYRLLVPIFSFFSSMPAKKHTNGLHTFSLKTTKTKRREKAKIQQRNVIIVSCSMLVFALMIYELKSYFKIEYFTEHNNNTDGSAVSNSDGRSNINGGWNVANAETDAKYGTKLCNVDRIDATQLSNAQFESVYRHKKPVIVTFPRGAGDWTEPGKWTVSSLRNRYGEWLVVSGNSREIVRRGGTGDVQTTLSHYLDKLMGDVDNKDEPHYVFDRHFYNDSLLPRTLKPPNYFKVQNGVDDSLFFLGSSGSGVSFHKHADAWNGVIYGRKRWFLYPVETTPPGGVYPGFTQLQWYNKIYPLLAEEDMPMECMQGPGEIFYLPEGIYHATINLGDTIAVGIQKKTATTEVQRLFYEEHSISVQLGGENSEPVKTQLLQRSVEIFERLLQLLPDNAEVHMKAGRLYSDLSQMGKALHHTEKAIELDGHFIIAILNLANIQAKKGNNNDAERLYELVLHMNPKLWDAYAYYGDFLVNENRPELAVDIYRKGTELEPNMLQFWTLLQLAQQRSGDMAGAEKTQKEIDRLQHP